MASLFDLLHGLTKVEVTGPDGNPAFYNPPETDSGKAPGKNALAFLQGAAKQERAGVEPSTSVPSNVQIGTQPTLDAQGNPGEDAPDTGSSEVMQNEHPLSFMRPSLKQASTDSLGLQTANSPALTTKGKTLIALLRGGIGALEGSKENNAGAGFQDAIEQPIQMAGQRQALQRGNLENQLTQAQIQNLPWQRAGIIANLEKTAAETANQSALAGKAGAEANAVPVETDLKRIQALTAKYKDQNGILYDVTTGKPLTPDASGMVETPADIASAMHVKPGTMLPAKQITEARNAAYGHLAGADPVVIAQIGQPPVGDPVALAKWGKQAEAIKTRMSAAPRLEMTLARPLQVADKANPGNTKYVTAGEAMKTGAAGAQSASVQVPKAAMKSEVPSNIGNQKLAFNTALSHADLLKQAAKALNNGDQQTLASIKNKFASEFGASGPVTAQAIAQAYTREVNKMLSGGHITDAEIGAVGSTLDPTRQNYKTVSAVLDAYKNLAQSKLNNLNQQKQNAINESQPNRNGVSSGNGVSVTDPQGGVHSFPDQKAADAYKAAIGIQ